MVRWDEMLRWGIEQITGTNILFFVILLWYILKARQCRFWFGLWYSNQILMHQKGRGSRYRVARNKVCWCVCDVIRLWRWRRREKDERRWEFIFYVIYFWPLSKMGIWFFFVDGKNLLDKKAPVILKHVIQTEQKGPWTLFQVEMTGVYDSLYLRHDKPTTWTMCT